MASDYVHGYDAQAHARLRDQAGALAALLHPPSDPTFAPGSHVLEIGCGVGAQTAQLISRHPGIRITALDVDERSVGVARAWAADAGLPNVTFDTGDIFALPHAEDTFDHAFVCFVLEHLSDPIGALRVLSKVLKPGATITVIEGDHGSAQFHPDDADARAAIECQVTLQARAGGDATLGRQLYPLLHRAGLQAITVSPRLVYVDGDNPALAESFTRNTFTAMVAAVRDRALAAALIEEERFDAGVRALRRTAEPDGVFCYTFFKATATVPPRAPTA
ncbi:MAG: methyltransferase domain-containing protein [Pseudomonadota bacterium]